MSTVEIREIELSQVPLVARLPQPGEAGADSPERMERYLRGEHHPHLALAPRQMWVAWADDLPVGYVSGHLTQRFSCDGELQKIYVVASYRRRGLGLRLVAELARWCGTQLARRICVNVGAESARPFYLAAGAVALQPHWMVWEDIRGVLESPGASARGAV
jgi:GNAT superfamily N-acetyltransferase